MKRPATASAVTELKRLRLSKSFFMRDMLFSEVAMVHGLINIPDDPDIAIAAGTRLCEALLEPLQEHCGPIAIRSSYRSSEVNGLCNDMQRAGKVAEPKVHVLQFKVRNDWLGEKGKAEYEGV